MEPVEEVMVKEIQKRFYEDGEVLSTDMEWLLEVVVRFFEFLAELEELADQPPPAPAPVRIRLVVIPGRLQESG